MPLAEDRLPTNKNTMEGLSATTTTTDSDSIKGQSKSDCDNVVTSETKLAEPAAAANDFLEKVTDVDGLEDSNYKSKIVWRNVILFSYLHMAAIAGVFMVITGRVMWQTLVFAWFLHILGGLGITAGAHRCYSHKSYKAKLPLKLLLTFMQTISFQNSMWEWVRDHRVHHKYSETNADPHNARRGFFFAHIGWLLVRKHDLVKVKGAKIDLSDIESDPVLMFQKKYQLPLGILLSFVVPAYLPAKLWGESVLTGLLVAGFLRYAFTLNTTWLVNSAAHMWGGKPYDKTINPAENRSVAFWALGEGWHNYHHVFPWDYKTAELGEYRYNLTTAFVDFFAKIGWAYDLKTVPKKIVEQRVKRTGDGSWAHDDHHDHHHHAPGKAPWGWGDQDIPDEDAKITHTLFPTKDE